jgi:hypothetical protein
MYKNFYTTVSACAIHDDLVHKKKHFGGTAVIDLRRLDSILSHCHGLAWACTCEELVKGLQESRTCSLVPILICQNFHSTDSMIVFAPVCVRSAAVG